MNDAGGRKATVMVVDDTQENLVLLATILQPAGYKVMTLPNGAMAIEAARARLPDLILMDIMMPGMDGYEACGILKADPLTAAIPIIFISALSEIRSPRPYRSSLSAPSRSPWTNSRPFRPGRWII